jgi:hypothetical protein
MPAQEYETLPNSVLAWKKNQKLGRFDPNAPDIEQQKIKALDREIEERGASHTTDSLVDPAIFTVAPYSDGLSMQLPSFFTATLFVLLTSFVFSWP